MKFKWTAILLIIFVLSGICLAQDTQKDADKELQEKIQATKDLINSLEQPLREFANSHPYGRFPDESEEQDGNGTSNLVEALTNHELYNFKDENLSKAEPFELLDAWGNPMRYHSWKGKKSKNNAHNRKGYDLWSAGPDGEFNTDDDINNWSTTLDTVVLDKEIELFFIKYFAVMNSYDAEKSLEFYRVPKEVLEEFKKNLTTEMTSMKKAYGEKPFIRNFKLKESSYFENVAKIVYESEFYIIEKKEWSKSESKMTLVKIGGKWKIDIFGDVKIESIEAEWLTVTSAMRKIIDAFNAFKKDSGSLEVLATDVWKPVSHILGAIKLDSEVLTSLKFFDLEDFHYITREIEGVYHYRLICIAWGGTKGGSTGKGPQIGYRTYDSEKDVFFEDFEAKQFDGLGKADIKETDDAKESEEKPKVDEKIDETTKTAIMAVVDGFFKAINSFDVEAVQKYIYIPAELKEKAKQRLTELFAELKKNSTDKDGNYVKEWELKKLEAVGKKAMATLSFYVFTDGEWELNSETYTLHWLEDKWVIDFFELIPEEEEKPAPEEKKEEVTEEDVKESSEINVLIDEFFKGFNAFDDERVLKCLFVPADKEDELIEKIEDMFINWMKLDIPDDQELFKDWTVNNVKIDGDKAVVRVEYFVFQTVNTGYYEEEADWHCVKIDGKWVVDLFLYSDLKLLEEKENKESIEELKDRIKALQEEVDKIQKENEELQEKIDKLLKEYEEEAKKAESSEKTDEDAVKDLFNKYCEKINEANADELAKLIYLPKDKNEEFKLQIKKWVENLVSNSGDTDAFIKNWKIMSIDIENNIAILKVEITVFKEGEWILEKDEIKFVKVNERWFFDMLELYKEKTEEVPEVPAEPDVDESALRKSLEALFDAINTRKAEELAKHVYLPDDKKEEYTKHLKEFIDSLVADAEDEDLPLVKDLIVNSVEIKDNKATIKFEFLANSGDDWVEIQLMFDYVKVDEDWFADFYDFSEKQENNDQIRNTVEQFVNATNELDAEKLLKIIYVDKNRQEKIKEEVTSQVNKIKEKLGDNKYVKSWEILNIKKQSDDVYNVEVQILVHSGEGDEYDEEKLVLRVVKTGGKWLVDLYYGFNSGVDKEKETDEPENAKVALAKASAMTLYKAVQIYYLRVEEYPETLEQLVTGPADFEGEWKSLIMGDKDALIDPWGNEYVLEYGEDDEVYIICLGADGKDGGEGVNADIIYPEPDKDE